MNSRSSQVALLHRFVQVSRVTVRQLTLAAVRRVRGRPVLGHLLLREGLERAGGLFIKVGQVMSLQIDMLPKEYCDALLSLLDNVPTSTREEISQVFVSEFGSPPEELYSEFDHDAIKSASIGQVHRARLRSGAPVAVKVRRPGVLATFHRDFLVLRVIVRLVFLLRIRGLYFLQELVDEQMTWTRDELDYRREASHCDLLARNAADSYSERIPKVFWDLTTSRVLTMEFLQGTSVSDYLRFVESHDQAALDRLKGIGFDARVFCDNVITNFLRDAFQFGVFHADLHPANLLILPDNVVGYVDFGIVAKLTEEARRKQIELTLALSTGDPDAIYRQYLNILSFARDADMQGMRVDIARAARTWYVEPAVQGKARFRVSITIAMMDMLGAARNHGARFDGEMVKYIRATILADGVVARLAPSLDLAQRLRSTMEDYLVEDSRRKIFSPGGFMFTMAEVATWLRNGPVSMLRALDRLERRQVNLKTFSGPNQAKERTLRTRILVGMAVWALVMVYLALGGAAASMRDSMFWAVVVRGFVTLWTFWLLVLVRQLLLSG